LRSGATGIFYPAVKKGQTVSKGALIGHTTDFHGNTVEEIRAPFDGQILYVIGTPPTTKGEPIAFITARATEAGFPEKRASRG
jgi:predicted deacylase